MEVTPRYAAAAPPVRAGHTRLLVRVVDSEGQRVKAAVAVTDGADSEFRKAGESRDEGADTNDVLEFSVPFGRTVQVVARSGELRGRQCAGPCGPAQSSSVRRRW